MAVFYWIVDVQIPLAMIVIGLIFRKWIPEKINHFVGYRTKRSTSSQEAWEYANRRFAELWLKLGCFLLPLIILIKLLLPFKPEHLTFVNTSLGLAAMLLSIPIVEKELKQKFKH